MVTTDLPAGPLRSCPVRLGRAFSASVKGQGSLPVDPKHNRPRRRGRINVESTISVTGRRARLGLADRG